MTFSKTKFMLGALAGVCVLGASAASAETPWEMRHPRQDEVLDRAHNQLHRINVERGDGEISHAQAVRLRSADRRIINEDHRLAYRNGGYITRGEQYAINRQENRVGRRIGW